MFVKLKEKTPWTQLSNPMVQNPSWGDGSFSVEEEFPHLLWNLKIHYCVHSTPPQDPHSEPDVSNSYGHISFPSRYILLSSHLFLHLQSYLFTFRFSENCETIQVIVRHPVSDQAHRCEVILDLTNQEPAHATVTLQYQHSKSLNSSQEANLAICADQLLLYCSFNFWSSLAVHS